MSPTELLALEKGRIPAQIVLKEIRSYLRESDELVATLELRASVSPETITTWLGQGRVQSIDFNIVDRLFCVMGRTHLFRTKYGDYYYGCNLTAPPAPAYPKCNHGVEYGHDKGSRREACPECGSAEARGECYHGHKMTPENTKTRKNGYVECRACHRRISNESYHRARARVA